MGNGCVLNIGLKFVDDQHLHQYAASMNAWIIFVKYLTGKTSLISCKESDKISAIKQHICESEGYPIKQQRLIHDGRTLNDDITLNEYNIKNRDSVNLVLKLRGF